MFGADGLTEESSSRMISLFRKYIVLRPALTLAVLTGICSCLLAAPAGAQVATRTQLATQEEDGVLTLTAKVADAEGAPIREGSVSFETTKGSLGSVFVQDGAATLNLKNPPEWARTVTAVYHGDTAFADSSAGAAVTPDPSGLPGFTVTASPGTLSLTPGDYSTVNLTVTSQNNFAEQVNLSCSGLPGASQCNFNPAVVTPTANGSVVSPMQITTTAPSGINSKIDGLFGKSGTAYALVIPGVLALAGAGALRRKHFGALRVLGLIMLLAAGSLGLSSCNARYSYEHYHPSPNRGTAPGTYTIVIAAYSSDGTSITNATSSDPNCAGATCIALTVK
jgi:Bacterial Ig-like domain (group 3)